LQGSNPMAEITSTKLTEVTRCLNESGVPWGLFGGAAAKIFGAKRPLQDIDILLPYSSGQKVAQYFTEAHLDYDGNERIASIELPGFDMIAGLIEHIHFILDAEMAARIRHHKLMGVDLPVLSIEDNIVFKAVLGRGSEIGKHDWEDVAALLNYGADLDWDYVRWRLQICAPKQAESVAKQLGRISKTLGKSTAPARHFQLTKPSLPPASKS
jgi:predicted nucleotidyltransferase